MVEQLPLKQLVLGSNPSRLTMNDSSNEIFPATKGKLNTTTEQTDKEEFGIEDLSQTEGFAKLTKRQQKIIRSSLLITRRWQNPENLESKRHIDIHNCHGAIASLEEEHFFKERTDELSDGFFKAKYFNISGEKGGEIAEQLLAKILPTGYPAVVHTKISINFKGNSDIPDYDPSSEGRLKPDHSFLVLGPNKKGKVMVWDKEGFFDQYRAISLEDVCDQHRAYKGWGIRSLKQGPSPATSAPGGN